MRIVIGHISYEVTFSRCRVERTAEGEVVGKLGGCRINRPVRELIERYVEKPATRMKIETITIAELSVESDADHLMEPGVWTGYAFHNRDDEFERVRGERIALRRLLTMSDRGLRARVWNTYNEELAETRAEKAGIFTMGARTAVEIIGEYVERLHTVWIDDAEFVLVDQLRHAMEELLGMMDEQPSHNSRSARAVAGTPVSGTPADEPAAERSAP